MSVEVSSRSAAVPILAVSRLESVDGRGGAKSSLLPLGARQRISWPKGDFALRVVP